MRHRIIAYWNYRTPADIYAPTTFGIHLAALDLYHGLGLFSYIPLYLAANNETMKQPTSPSYTSDDRSYSGSPNTRNDFPLPPDLSIPSQFQRSVLSNDNNTQKILQDILQTLQDSNIADKGEKDIRSRFWETYSKVAKEHDDEFLERNNSDMDIVLIFSGLFSAINTAFIIAMQPNSTNILLSQIVQNTSPNTTIASFTGSVTDSINATWFQGFAYVALSFSLLAAFGAVLGKQWLSHYKSNNIHGSLGDRGKHRQRKLDGLGAWGFHAVLQSFPVLLQISLLLFGLALSAFVWSQQGTLAVTVVVSTAFGILFYAFVLVASLKSPECPFQTPISVVIRWLWRRIWHKNGNVQPLPDAEEDEDEEAPASAPEAPSMRWIFEVSTDPEVISSAAWLLPTIRWAPELDMPTVLSRLTGTFESCFYAGVQLSCSARQRALACGRALHHVICDETVPKQDGHHLYLDGAALASRSDWRGLAVSWGLEDCKTSFEQYTMTLDEKHADQACVALRLAIVTGCPGFLMPTDVTLIWDGVFDWNGDQRTPEDFDWLVDFLAHFRTSNARNFDAMADALLALSAMRRLGSPTRRDNYLSSIIFSMNADNPSRLRHAALRAIFDARFELVYIADNEKGEFRKRLLRGLPLALLTATEFVAPQPKELSDSLVDFGRDYLYLQLIFTLAGQSDWREKLDKAGHIDRCISLLDHVINDLKNYSPNSLEPIETHPYYLAGTLIRMNTAENYRSSDFMISELEWWKLLKGAWSAMWWNNLYREDEPLQALPDIAKYTLEALEMEPAKYDSSSLVRLVDRIYEALIYGNAKPDTVSAVKCVKDKLDSIGS